MKKLVIAAITMSLLAGCGSPANLGGKDYPTYGLFNQDTAKSEKVCYEISVGNVVWSVLLVESFVFPIYFIGWSIYNPVKLKPESGKCGIDE